MCVLKKYIEEENFFVHTTLGHTCMFKFRKPIFVYKISPLQNYGSFINNWFLFPSETKINLNEHRSVQTNMCLCIYTCNSDLYEVGYSVSLIEPQTLQGWSRESLGKSVKFRLSTIGIFVGVTIKKFARCPASLSPDRQKKLPNKIVIASKHVEGGRTSS